MAATPGLLGLTVAAQASAGCTFAVPSKATASARMTPAVYHPDEAQSGSLGQVSDFNFFGPSILGLWKIQFLAKGNTNGIPDGALIDFGTSIWSLDGTEIMVSGGRQPATGDVCMGADRARDLQAHAPRHGVCRRRVCRAGRYRREGGAGRRGQQFPRLLHDHRLHTLPSPPQRGHEFDETNVMPPTPIVGTINGVRVKPN
ncbi:MAG TPA: hypothetical protein VLX90_01405 [Steroidobacteraceae bacterium]|nr:hypothetical protein [Steroidobacteraceae bacterium]